MGRSLGGWIGAMQQEQSDTARGREAASARRFWDAVDWAKQHGLEPPEFAASAALTLRFEHGRGNVTAEMVRARLDRWRAAETPAPKIRMATYDGSIE